MQFKWQRAILDIDGILGSNYSSSKLIRISIVDGWLDVNLRVLIKN